MHTNRDEDDFWRKPGCRESIADLVRKFESEVRVDKRAAAETAYALAYRYRDEDIDGRRQFNEAKAWAGRAIELLDGLPSDSIHQVVSSRMFVGGVPIPELFHSGVVRSRLNDVLMF